MVDYYVDDTDVATTNEFGQVCDNFEAMIIGHEKSRDTSLFIPQNISINMEDISSQLDELGIVITGTNFGQDPA